MPPPDDRSALRDIQFACELVASFIRGARREDFVQNQMAFSATERQLAIVGEAVKRLSADLRMSAPQIDWRGWSGLRDVLVHAYDDVDREQIWIVASVEMPTFAIAITELLAALENHGIN